MKRVLTRGIRIASPADARNPKELHKGEARDQRAAADAGCEEDEFFGNDLHGNSWRGRDEAGAPLPIRCGTYRRLESHQIEAQNNRALSLTASLERPILLAPADLFEEPQSY